MKIYELMALLGEFPGNSDVDIDCSRPKDIYAVLRAYLDEDHDVVLSSESDSLTSE